jgi:TRAP-type transport system periplasmic protein
MREVLGDEPDMVKMVQDGELEGAYVTSFSLEEVVPETLVLLLPLLFQDEFEMDFILEKYEPLFAQYAYERGIEILGIFSGGCSPIFSTVPISGFDEIRDKKVMRLENSTFFTRPFGADGIPLSFSEVESALNSGKVEVVLGPPAAVVVLGWYPYIRYIVMECTVPVIIASIVNREVFQKLPEKARSIIKKFVREQRKILLKRFRRDNEIAMLGLMKRGVNIIRFSPEEMEHQREATKPFWDSGVGKFYSRELLNNILRDLEAYRADQNRMESKK